MKTSLNLVASNYDKDTREVDNVYNDNKFDIRLVKSAVVYGANASGKSKFFEALNFMKYFVISSSKDSQKGDEIDTEPFKLSSETENSPSEFEVVFTHNDVMFRYGFEVDKRSVISEWLYYKPKTKEIVESVVGWFIIPPKRNALYVSLNALDPIEPNLKKIKTKQNFFRDFLNCNNQKQTNEIKNEIKFKSIFDHAALGITYVDTLTGKFSEVNKKFCEMTGYTNDELKNLDLSKLIHPDNGNIIYYNYYEYEYN